MRPVQVLKQLDSEAPPGSDQQPGSDPPLLLLSESRDTLGTLESVILPSEWEVQGHLIPPRVAALTCSGVSLYLSVHGRRAAINRGREGGKEE